MIPTRPKQILNFLALNPIEAVIVFGLVPVSELHALRQKLVDPQILKLTNTEEVVQQVYDDFDFRSCLPPIVRKIAKSNRGDSMLFSYLSVSCLASLVKSIDAAIPEAEVYALREAKQKLKDRQTLFLNKPKSISDETPYSGISTSKPVSKKTCKTVKPKYVVGSGKEKTFWSGRGLKPKAIREALDNGAKLDDLKIEPR